MTKPFRLHLIFSIYLSFWHIGLHAAPDVTRMWFTPIVIPENYKEPIRFEASVTEYPASVAFEYDGMDRPMFDDGTHGDRTAGDGIWSILFQPHEILGKLTDAWVFRPFIGYCKPEGSGRYNIFAEIWTSAIGIADIEHIGAETQATDNLVNFVASSAQLMSFDPTVWAQKFYSIYGDEFDFLNFVHIAGRRSNRYHSLVKNDVLGIGLPAFDNTGIFGSNGRLKGYTVFPLSALFDTASVAFNHETGHQWINFLQGTPFASGIPHWPKGNVAINAMGFSIASSGQGGRYFYTFTPNADGSFFVGPGDPNNTSFFNSLELYLIGLVPYDEVETYFILKNQNQDMVPGQILHASEIIPVTVQDIIDALGPRMPSSASAQRNFRCATIVLSEQPLDPYSISFFDSFAGRAQEKRKLLCSDGFSTSTCNPFYLATNGRASMITNLRITESVRLSLTDGGVNSTSTTGNSPEMLQAGYATVSVATGTNPYGTAVFSYEQGNVTVSEAGIPASPPTTSARVFIDFRYDVDAVPGRPESGKIDVSTGIAVVNYGSATANVTYTLLDTSGDPIATGHGVIPAQAHFAKFIDYLKDEAPDFNLPPDFSITTQFASLDISSDQPLSVLALRGAINQRNEFLMATTPIADLTRPLSSDPIYYPQFADGDGYTTSLILLNTSSSIETGIFQIFDNDGVPMVVNQVGGTAGSSFRYVIPPDGVFRFQTDGSSAGLKVGWVRLIPDAGTSTPVGSGVFSFNPGNILVTEAGIPATVATTHARLYVDLSGNHNTGLAIANVSNTNASIIIGAFESDGSTGIGISQGPLLLAPNGHDARFADRFIEGLPFGFTGVLDISSTTPFAVLTLRTLMNERDDFLMTTFPVADANQPAHSPIVFPQIADGGGYKTHFVLISPGGASDTVLRFYDDNGIPLAVGR